MTITEFLRARLAAPIPDWGDDLCCAGSGEYWACDAWSDWHERTIQAQLAIVKLHDDGHECPDGWLDSAETAQHTGWVVDCLTLRHLASVYADHPDYDPAWSAA